MKILVADDSEAIRSRIVSGLKEIKVVTKVYEARLVSEAYQILMNEKPDVLLLDIRIPETNGIEVLKWLKINACKTETIVLTNYPYPEYERKCLQLGARYFLNKTTEFDKVFDIINSLNNTGLGKIKPES